MNSRYLSKVLSIQNLALIYLLTIYFLSPFIWYITNLKLPSFSVNQQHVNLASIALGFLACFFFYIGTIPRLRKIKTKCYNWSGTKPIIASIVLILCGIAVKLIRVYTGEYLTFKYANPEGNLFIFQYLVSLNIFFIFAFNVSAVSYYSNLYKKYEIKLLGIQKNIMWIQFILFEICYFFSNGNKFFMITLLFNLILIKFIYSKKISIIAIAAFLVSFILIFPLKIGIQNIDHLKALTGIGLETNADNRSKGLIHIMIPDSNYYYKIESNVTSENLFILDTVKFSLDAFLGRINQAHIMGVVSERFWINLLNKRSEEDLDIFSLFLTDTETGIGVTLLCELLDKYKIFALFIIALIGYLYKQFEIIFNTYINDNNIFIYVSLYSALIANLGQNIWPYLLANIKLMLISLLVILFIILPIKIIQIDK